MLRRAAAVIDSLDLVVAFRGSALAECDSNRAIENRIWGARLESERASYERVLAASKPDTWGKLKDILITAGAVYVGAMAVK